MLNPSERTSWAGDVAREALSAGGAVFVALLWVWSGRDDNVEQSIDEFDAARRAIRGTTTTTLVVWPAADVYEIPTTTARGRPTSSTAS